MNLVKEYTGVSYTIFTFATFVSLELFPNKSFSKLFQVYFVAFAAQALQSTFSPVEPGDQEYLSTFLKKVTHILGENICK